MLKNVLDLGEISVLKKVILKKIGVCEDAASTLRIFSIHGEEFCDYEALNLLKNVEVLYYSFGEDYNYKTRLATL